MRQVGNFLGSQSRSRLFVATLMVALSTGVVAFWVQSSSAEIAKPGVGDQRVTKSVAFLLEHQHLLRHLLDDEMSQRALDTFLKTLDPMKLHFLQSDIDEFNEQRNNIDDQIKAGNIKLAYDIFNRFLTRLEERNKIADELLDGKRDFTIDEEMVTDRDKLQYAKNRDELKERWRKRIKYDLLVQKADDVELAEAKKKLRRRYHSFAKRMQQTDKDELLEMYLTALTTGFDPHTTYMSASTLENFEINMKLELDGIGASLQSEDGYTTVHKIIPGGAADKDGKLKPKDQIVSVGQGEDGEMVDVVDKKLSDVVKLIRGKRGTVVRLGVKRAADNKNEIYNITRARIELKDSEARSEIIPLGKEADGSPFVVGWIDLPSFYMDMSAARLGKRDFKSTTRDVRKILDNFKAKGVDAVVVDLRRNGGGSLTESVNLTGLFIEDGPVVQVKGFDGQVEAYADRYTDMPWKGPLVVLTSKFSASASEIFAGAIQDYKRGIIVGDKTTHGKGTVQQLLDLGRRIFQLPNAPNLGALKITIQQFYRPSGDSTQNRGVLSDIELPSLTTHLDVGEADLDFALKFDKVESVPFKKYNDVDDNIINALRNRSSKRINGSEDFKKVTRNIASYIKQKERKRASLNEEKFLAERAELNADKEEEKVLKDEEDPDKPFVKKDFYFDEVIGITRDYVDMLKKNKVAQK